MTTYPKERNPNWKGGKPHCISCGKLLAKYGAKHCKSHRPISKKTRMLYRKRMLGNTFAKGKNLGNTHGFKKGFLPWNKGMKEYQAGKTHYAWKGNGVGYFALHSWIRRKLGKPNICEHCRNIFSLGSRKLHWANKSGKYLRQLSDWLRLCASCHKLYDSNRLPKKDH